MKCLYRALFQLVSQISLTAQLWLTIIHNLSAIANIVALYPSTLLQHLDNPTPSPLQPPPATRTCSPNHPLDSLNTTHTLLPAPPLSINVDGHHIEFPNVVADSNRSDFEDNKSTAAEFKPSSFSLEQEADVAMDMDTVIDHFEDDEHPWEEVLGQYNSSDSEMGTDRDKAEWDSD